MFRRMGATVVIDLRLGPKLIPLFNLSVVHVSPALCGVTVHMAASSYISVWVPLQGGTWPTYDPRGHPCVLAIIVAI